MMQPVILHNPRCSKSRETLELLTAKGFVPQVIEYLKEPPGEDFLKDIVSKLKMRPREIVRSKEPIFGTLNLNLEDDLATIKALVRHPVLLERPIVIFGSNAAIGRPPEHVLSILPSHTK